MTTREQCEAMRSFIVDLHRASDYFGGDIDGGDFQDLMDKHGLVDKRLPKEGSPEADEWGTEDELYYLKPWVVRDA